MGKLVVPGEMSQCSDATLAMSEHEDHRRRRREDPVWSWAQTLPKLDLHRHLEGSLRLTTLTELARAHHIRLPSYDVEGLRPHVQMIDDPPSFQRFIGKFKLLRQFYTSKEVVQRITREAIIDAGQDNLIYLELRFNPLALAQARDFTFAEVVAWVAEATAEAESDTGVRTCLILQIPRNESLRVAEEIVDVALASFGSWVRGIDLAGDEVNYPPEAFITPFQRAFDAGLNITVHAGEAMGANSVRRAILHLHPQRIGHGIRAIENSAVVRMLYEQQIALEVCPTSNLHTGVVSDLAQHPLADLLNLRLRVTLNTDDPSISDTTLSDEVWIAAQEIGLVRPWIYRMLRNALEAAFVPPEEKPGLRARLRASLVDEPEALAVFDAG
jgi:adenosine deaminase